jgi:hypothetical protein
MKDTFKLLVIIGLFTLLAAAGDKPNKPLPAKKTVSLDTVLSCVDDSLLNTVFKTDAHTALRMNFIGMSLVEKNKPDYSELLAKGFTTHILSGSERLEIWPTDYRGKIIDNLQLPFCRHEMIAIFSKLSDGESSPSLIEIGGKSWTLNSSEIFAHANQFEFSSGVFSNSSEVFFTATKGRVSIQFICKPAGLSFYRAMYYPEAEK